MTGRAMRQSTGRHPSLRKPGSADAACFPPSTLASSTLDCDIKRFGEEGPEKFARPGRALWRVAGEIGDPRRRIDEARHPRMAGAMLFCDRHRIRDIARIHDLGGRGIAALQEWPLRYATGEPGCRREDAKQDGP